MSNLFFLLVYNTYTKNLLINIIWDVQWINIYIYDLSSILIILIKENEIKRNIFSSITIQIHLTFTVIWVSWI